MKTLKILTLMATVVITIGTFAVHSAIVKNKVIQQGYAIGDEAIDFKLKNIDGREVSLSDTEYKDVKGFIIIFTCNHCPYSVAYEDRIIALDLQFKPLGYPVIAINPNNPTFYPEDSFEQMKVRALDKGFTFPYLWDEKQEVYPMFGAQKTPQVYVLEKTDQANIVRYIGAIDNNYKSETLASEPFVANALNALLSGEKIQVAHTKAIGCSIKK